MGLVTFHLAAASDVQTKSGRGKKGDRDQNLLKIYNAIILFLFFQAERDSLVVCTVWASVLETYWWDGSTACYCLKSNYINLLRRAGS